MIRNYLTTAWRNFTRNKIFSAINVIGLSIGISAALVISLIVFYEYSYDRYLPDGDRIYRVVLTAKFNGSEGHSAGVPAPLGAAIENEVTGVTHTVPVFQFQGDATAKVRIIKKGTGLPLIFKRQDNIVFTNAQYFSLIPHQWIAGSASASLKDPFTVVLTESRARQYFGSTASADVLGREITYNDEFTATVSGVVKDLHERTSFSAVEFLSLPTIAKTNLQSRFMMNVWNDWMAYSQLYVKLSQSATVAKTEAQFKMLVRKYFKEANKDANNSISFHLQPLRDLHFNTKYPGFGQRIAHKPTLYGLMIIAAFLLILGCINFINLTTAQAAHRAKEIGIRKTMGSSRSQLVWQFLSETFFITLLATLLSVALAPPLLNIFHDFIPEGLNADFLYQPTFMLFLAMLILLVSFLSGLYPALILSGYKPVSVLKNMAFTSAAETRNAWLRKTLTVSQFVIAQFFVIATVLVQKQINYSLNADMGFNKEAIVNFSLPRDTVAAHGKQVLHEIKRIPGIAEVSVGFFAPADEGVAFTNIAYHNGREKITPNTQIRWGDPEYLKVYGLKLVAGRNVMQSDTVKEFLVNESFARAIGFAHPENAVDRHLHWNGKNVPIVGVMKDFHDQGLQAPISPVVFAGSSGTMFHVKLAPDNKEKTVWKNALLEMQKVFKQVYPEEDFNYSFLDETIVKFYKAEQQTANLLRWATALSILISCLGLTGLVMFTINTRTKEIGIRKILGASVADIVSVLSLDFMRLVLVAFVIAMPLAWLTIYRWLEDYAYRTKLSWWIFLLCGVAMLFLAMIILSVQTIKAAIANPAKSLRTE